MEGKTACFPFCPSARMGVQGQGEGDHLFCRHGEKRGNPLRLRGAKPLDQSFICKGVIVFAIGGQNQMILHENIEYLPCAFKALGKVYI